MKCTVYNIQGKETGAVDLLDSVFNIEPSEHAIYEDVRLILANRRQGTHKVKERGEVSGSTKKPFRQKGTGGARAGHKRSPLWRHGGTVHGPRPRDYGFKLNKKVKQLARRSALSVKARNAQVHVLDSFQLQEGKTKEFKLLMENLKIGGKALFVTPDYNTQFYKAGKNLPNTYIVSALQLNTYDIMIADAVVLAKESVDIIQQQLG